MKLRNQIISLLLSLLVMVSTTSFTINKHFCGAIHIDTSVIAPADHCGMPLMDADNDCCKDVTDAIDGQDDLRQMVKESLSFDQVYLPHNEALFEITDLSLMPSLQREWDVFPPPFLGGPPLFILHDSLLI